MKTSSKIPSQLLKLLFRNLFIIILTLFLRSQLASSQQIAVTYNDTRQSLNQTQALSCDLAPANNQQKSLLSNNNVNKNIPDRGHEDLDNAAATTSIVQMGPANVGPNSIQDQETSPSVTSVHQVWTSSSSGGIGELSPEIISKLRNDVPFLAAYALRPRLVGASSQDDVNNPILSSSRVNNDASKQLISNSQPIDSYVGQIQPPASAEKASLQVQASSPSATKSLIPKLGDFSEFNVETSSTSKSEHHHKRKTTLKRNSNDTDQLDLKRRGSASQSVKGGRSNGLKRISLKNKKQKLKAGKTNKRGRRGRVGIMRNRLRSKKPRGKPNKGDSRQHMNIIKSGRYYQEHTISPMNNDKSTDIVIDSKSAGDQTTTVVSGTKGSSEGDVKGGSLGERKPPFYSRAKPSVDETDPMNDVNKSTTNDVDSDKNDSDINSLDRTRSKDEEENTSGAGEPDDEMLEEPLEPPRRVGDDDVEEDGDTVTVMPKSDGVDDDPEIPVGAPEEDQSGPADGDQDGSREREGDSDGRNSGTPESQDEPRARRVDRERPNPDLKPNNDSNGNDDGGRDITAGGGIGATTGGGGGAGDASDDRNIGSTSSQDDDRQDDGLDSDQDRDKFGSRGGSSGGSGGDARAEDDRSIGDQDTGSRRSEMGKESNGSDEEDDNRFDNGSSSSKGVSKDNSDLPDNDSRKSTSSGEQDEYGSRRSGSNDRDLDRDNKSDGNNKNTDGDTKPLCRGDGSPCLDGGSDDEGGDVDYRDEMAESALGKKNGRNETTEVTTSKEVDEQSITTKKKTKKVESEEKDCDDHHHHKDGHYNHHEHDHHDHHDSIKWLQDAIPGEPGEDYPILSRINLSNFNCRDQKYPGYYADVQSRCQVFHICQADGRQDSFLCPNGTIFSQISTVCVWWNSFDCEDTNIPLDDLKPLDGARINPKDMTLTTALDEGDDSPSSIDGLIRAMRKKENPATESGVSYYGQGNKESMMDTIGKGLNEDDEASIQRKSTNIEPDSSLSSGTSSRLRRGKGRRESRRKRRASVRQAPPKLKSRRVSRNSRRRKLRHGIKPKRRA